MGEPTAGAEAPRRVLIVNADDFGRTEGINAGVARAHEQGVVTSASLMVRWPAAGAAAAYAARARDLALGLHADLGEWMLRDGRWEANYEVVPLDDQRAVVAEVRRQVDAFRELSGRDPTHLDSHQHVHKGEAGRAFTEIAAELEVPLRDSGPAIRYCGDFYGQSHDGAPMPEAIAPPSLIEIIRRLGPGITEVGCHPGEGRNDWSAYDSERAAEVRTLCDPAVRDALAAERVTLASFADLPAQDAGAV